MTLRTKRACAYYISTLLSLTIVLSFVPCLIAAPLDDLQSAFLNPPDDARIMMRWWWFGPAVDKAQLEREMRLMKEGGMGGFEVQPVYALVLDDASKGIKTTPFLSNEFLESLRFTADKAKELGLRFDLTLGSGWPFGGPMVSIEHAAARLRTERVKVDPNQNFVKVPSIGAGEKLLAVFIVERDGSSIVADSVRELTNVHGGIVELKESQSAAGPAQSKEVQFFISSRTGMQVKRPAVGSEGFVLDHMNRAATDHYLKTVGDRLMSAFGANKPYAIFCDSLEVYNADWSSDFLEEFQKRRSYDLKPHLPALVNDMGPKTQALRRDWGRTLTDLLNERFLAPMQEWSRKNGVQFRIQDYGVPAATISSNAFADIPEGEGAQWKVVRASRWASSASHLYSRPIASSETWTWLHSPSFRATPLDMKAEADVHFLQGINQLIGHGWPYTPQGIEYPGFRFYAAAVFNEKNPWWIAMPDISKYLQRISFLMRQGQPANDVALYLPNDDGWAHMNPGNPHLIDEQRKHVGPDLIPAILESGYNLDFFDDDSFKQVGRIEKGALVLGQNRYKIVILPGVETISPEIYRKFQEFQEGGGILIATRKTPSRAPGLQSGERDSPRVVEISNQLFSSRGLAGYFVTDEKKDLRERLRSLAKPDIDIQPAVPEIGFIHRRTADAEIYFIANTSNATQKVSATFPLPGMTPELWDPFTGNVTFAQNESPKSDSPKIALELEPYGSRVVVFTKRTAPAVDRPTVSNIPTAVDLSTNWRVTVGSGAAATWDKLRSWADDVSTRYHSGLATYEKDLNVSNAFLQKGLRVRLNFGEGIPLASQRLQNGMQAWLDGPVREAAVVYINDKRVGAVWCPPYSLDVTEHLKSGNNKIRIVVGNTAMNYMAGHSLPDYRLLNLRYGERFTPQDMDKIQALPSGMLGPVTLSASVK